MRQVARFGRLARLYVWMEYLSFGPYLERCRNLRLSEMAGRKRALVYGDGDGRFLAGLVGAAPVLPVMAVDASSAMLQRARQRLPSQSNVQLMHADARIWEPPRDGFDLVVSHFFLDCFGEGEVAGIVSQVNAAAAGDAIWVVSEFAIPPGPVAGPAGRVVIRTLYLAFALLTGLAVRRLPDYRQVLRDGGWRLENRRELLLGLLVSERWRRMAASDN